MAYRELMLKDFYKGVNLSSKVNLSDYRELLIGTNIVINPNEGYSNRPGLKYLYNGSEIMYAKPFTVMWEPKGRGYLIFSGNKLYYLSTDLSNMINIGSGIVYREDVEIVTPVVMGTKLYFVTGTKFYEWDMDLTHQVAEVTPKSGGSLDAIKLCTILLVRNNFLYATGSVNEPSLVYFSALGDASDFPTTNAIKAITNDGDKLTSLVEFLDKLVAMKYYSAYAGSGSIPTTELVWSRMIVHEGTVSPASFSRVLNSLAIMGRNGIYLLSAVYTDIYSTSNVSVRLNDYISSLTHKEKVRMTNYQNRLYILTDGDGDGLNDTILVGHNNLLYEEKSMDDNSGGVQLPFTIWNSDGFYPLQLFGNLNDELMVFHKVGGNVHISKFDENIYRDEFNGKAIKSRAKHKIDFTKPLNSKSLNSIILYLRQNAIEGTACKFKYKLDYVESGWINIGGAEQSGIWGFSDWNESYWGWIDAVPVEIPLRRRGYVLEIDIEHDVIDEPFTLYGIGFKYKLKKIKGVRNK